MKKFYLVLLALSVCFISFPQISEITRLSVQNPSQSIKESAPVWLSENEIIIFYVNESKDTIFSTRSTNRGKNWDQPKVVQTVQLIYPQDALYLTALRKSTGRIFLAWSVLNESMKLIYSNDNGNSWLNPISILGGGSLPVFTKSSYYLNLSEWISGEICLSFYSNGASKSYYKLSFDNGVTWSLNPIEFPASAQYKTKELTIISTGLNSLLAVYENSVTGLGGIYSRLSTDYGLNWSDPIPVINEIYYESRPRVAKLANGNILLAYQNDKVEYIASFSQTDIYYKLSEDQGESWLPSSRFTNYVGEDISFNVSAF
ncbi:MAG: glycoside hydrolase, partial [Ignavibacteria bacterium]|nr:glycoside hydrolase [Ignavibacteria bacterium]